MKRLYLLFSLLLTIQVSFCRTSGEINEFTNPVIWADVPDPDVIRVGNDFYMVSTTMHLMPGAPVMHSRDLVHWSVASYIFNSLTDSPKYDMQGGTVYGRGQWATSLKYHKGKFYALFAPNDNPGGDTYIYTADSPEKEWTLHSRLPHFHDASLFFDDDGRVYVFSGTGRLQELNSDLTALKHGGVDTLLFQRDAEETGLLEGSRVIKHDGKYYLLMISWPSGGLRRQLCFRADSITGPYEKRVILKDNFAGFPYVGQGTIVDDIRGNWYGMIFQDRGGVGRVLTLSPCHWIDGWPIIGDANGRVPLNMKLPVVGCAGGGIVTSDEFSTDHLGLNWQWNHNPINSSWSLTERRGYLRLKTSRIVDNLFLAPNTISQRMEGPRCSGVVSLDVSHLMLGDKTGFSAFNGNSEVVTVSKAKRGYELTMSEATVNLSEKEKAVTSVDEKIIEKVSFHGKHIYIRIDADFRLGKDIATFYYSLDNKKWTRIGSEYRMIYDYRRLFMGSRFAIFNYATKTKGGYVDVDFFRYNKSVD